MTIYVDNSTIYNNIDFHVAILMESLLEFLEQYLTYLNV